MTNLRYPLGQLQALVKNPIINYQLSINLRRDRVCTVKKYLQ